ncbi:Gustatory receptor 47 [Halyomorpha halys]|nr:Gustatory receptor 47 [Halyomorpha halys]
MPQRPTKPISSNFIFKASSVLGIFPFRNVDNVLQMNNFLLFYSLVVVSIFTTCTSSYFFSHNNNLVELIIAGSSHIFLPLYLFCIYRNRKLVEETFNFLNSVQLFFDGFEKNNWNISAKRKSYFDYVDPLLGGAAFFYLGSKYDIGHTFLITLIFLAIIIGFGQFTVLAKFAGDLFDSASRILKRMRSPLALNKLDTVKQVVLKTNRVITTCDNIKDIYTIQSLFTIFLCFSSIIFNVYYFYSSVILNKEDRIGDGSENIAVILILFYIIWRGCHSSAQAYYKCKEFNSALYQLMIEDNTNEILHNEMLRLHISMKREVVFTACGFFNLDYTLLHSIFASTTTYLIILIQFTSDP